MSDFGDAIGTAAEGGLFAKAVSGKAGALTDKEGNLVKQGHFAEGQCLNCGTELVGDHCHACGQKAHLHCTIGAFLHDLLHGALHLDGKVWRTLPMLVFKPGRLTRRYIEGERARFVSPMAMFLFSVFLMFAVFQVLGLSASDLEIDDPNQVWNVDAARADIAADMAKAREERAEVVEQIEAAQSDPTLAENLPQLNEQLGRLDRRIANFEEGARALDNLPLGTESAMQPSAGDPQENAGNKAMVSLAEDATARMTIGKSGVDWIDDALDKWRTNPGLMLYKMQTNAYKFSWLLIPLSIPFVWLLFAWKRRFKAYDHAIFVTYSITFVSLLFIVLSLLTAAGIGGGWVFLALAVLPPLHLYKHLKYAYDLSRFGAIWRLLVVHVFILVVLLVFFQLLLILGAF